MFRRLLNRFRKGRDVPPPSTDETPDLGETLNDFVEMLEAVTEASERFRITTEASFSTYREDVLRQIAEDERLQRDLWQVVNAEPNWHDRYTYTTWNQYGRVATPRYTYRTTMRPTHHYDPTGRYITHYDAHYEAVPVKPNRAHKFDPDTEIKTYEE